MWFRKRNTLRRLADAHVKLVGELEAEQAINAGLRKALVIAADPYNASADRVQELIDRAHDADEQIVQAPDGEYIAPEAFDWERLAHDMRDQYREQFKRPEDDHGQDGAREW